MRLPNLLATRFGRLTAFFLLYVTEGVPLGFTATAIATQMRRQGLGPTEIGLFVGTLYLPWAWKWLVGPVVDVVYSNRFGRRRGWILAMQVLMSVGLMAIMPIDFTAQLKLFTAIVLLINFFSATQDVAIDALACGVLTEAERGFANGMMFAGAYVGQAIGGSGVLLLTQLVGFNSAFFLVAGCILAVTVLVVLPMREPRTSDTPAADALRLANVFGTIRNYSIDAARAFIGTRAALAGLIFALLPAGAYSLSLALASNLAVEIGMSDSQIGYITLVSTIISALGCVAGGFLSDRLGRRRMLALYLVGTAIPTFYLAFVMHQLGWVLPRSTQALNQAAIPATLITTFWLASIVYSIFQGLMYGTRTAAFMDICTPKVAATQFTAYMALLNFVIWYSSAWQGWAIEHWGYPITLTCDGFLGLACILILPLMKKTPEISSPELSFPVIPVADGFPVMPVAKSNGVTSDR